MYLWIYNEQTRTAVREIIPFYISVQAIIYTHTHRIRGTCVSLRSLPCFEGGVSKNLLCCGAEYLNLTLFTGHVSLKGQTSRKQ